MSASKRRAPYGFTLVELLTVIFVIALLISILVPALNAVRDQARNAKTSGELSSIGKGAELFHGELGKYPHSHGRNPFFSDDNVVLTGAQWLAVQLVGPDMRGYVKPELAMDTDDNGEIDEDDWQAWYELDPARAYPRLGPYVPTEGDVVQSFVLWGEGHAGGTIEGDLEDTGDRWSNDRVPFFVDAYGLPILYYAASTYAKKPFTTGTAGNLEYGRYDQSDNAGFTGTEGDNGRNPGYQAGLDPYGDAEPLDHASQVIYHPMGILGYDSGNPNAEPEPRTFADVIMDWNIFEANRVAGTDEGRVWPHNADSFILVSPGKDGLWGTRDDVSNIQRGD
jgi:prepilin-type N-terminal cleavage/methylation domain-containing protein